MSLVPAHLARVVLPLAILAIAWAHRALLQGDPVVPSRADAERWLFAPSQASPLLVVGLAAWLLWRRRGRLAHCHGHASAGFAAGLLGAGLAIFAWTLWSGSTGLLALALSLQILGLAAGTKGRPGMRVVLLPAVVLLLAIPVPPVLHNELVWRLQVWTTAGSSTLLSALGFEVQHADALIRIGEHQALVVVEACSGLRGIQILLVVALIVRELFAAAGARAWVAVAVAPVLGGALNVVRVASIALTEDPQVRVSIARGHLAQGLTVTIVGTVILYALGLWTSRGQGVSLSRVDDAEEARSVSREDGGEAGLGRGTRIVALTAAMLVFLSAWPLPKRASPDRADPSTPSVPMIALSHAGWNGTDLELDWLATGELPLDPIVRRRYERPTVSGTPQVVDLFVAYHDPSRPTESPFSSKLIRPGPEWSLRERRTVQIWPLALAADQARVRSGSALALVYHWHLRDEGRVRSDVRSLLGLDRLGTLPGAHRAVVRLETPLEAAGPVARDKAKRVLDRFIRDFVDDLERL